MSYYYSHLGHVAFQPLFLFNWPYHVSYHLGQVTFMPLFLLNWLYDVCCNISATRQVAFHLLFLHSPKVHFTINSRDAHDDVHIYSSVSGAVISWLTAKQLGILPDSYPQPAPALHKLSAPVTTEQLVAEFPTVFEARYVPCLVKNSAYCSEIMHVHFV